MRESSVVLCAIGVLGLLASSGCGNKPAEDTASGSPAAAASTDAVAGSRSPSGAPVPGNPNPDAAANAAAFEAARKKAQGK